MQLTHTGTLEPESPADPCSMRHKHQGTQTRTCTVCPFSAHLNQDWLTPRVEEEKMRGAVSIKILGPTAQAQCPSALADGAGSQGRAGKLRLLLTLSSAAL
jgi:hypothetical protein